MGFNYHNTEVKTQAGGKKIVRKVTIKSGKGYKIVTKYNKSKKTSSIKKPIHKQHIASIQKGKFVPGLFKDCCSREKTKTRKKRVR
jgi:hypothetical protein